MLYPTMLLHRVTDITREQLEQRGVCALLLDVDNTLTTHNNPVPEPDVLDWLHGMRAAGISMVLVSNNKAQRVQPFAQRLSLPFTSRACKPLPVGFRRAVRQLGLPPAQIAVVGDQIFTDILGGNWIGATTILLEPIQPETGWFFRLKRHLEVFLLHRYRKREGGQHA